MKLRTFQGDGPACYPTLIDIEFKSAGPGPEYYTKL